MTERDALLHHAKVLLAESINRRHMAETPGYEHHRGFSFVLLEWAGNARRKALAATERDLFGVRA